MTDDKPEIFFTLPALAYRTRLADSFVIHDFFPAAPPPQDMRDRVRVLATTGAIGCSAAMMEMMPALGLVHSIGTGIENIDLAAARARGVLVSHAAGSNAAAVADHAVALLLAVMRNIPALDASVRRGEWDRGFVPRPILAGKRVGLIGIGGIGQHIARRVEGFGTEIAYMATRPRPELPWEFHADAVSLAGASDVLVSAIPASPATHHMIGRAVFEALGPGGFFVNVGRGSTVDTQALVAALTDGRIAGAGLDVFEAEPDVPEDLRALPNVVLTPHTAGVAPEAQSQSAALMRRNVQAFLAGQPLLTPVPGMPASY